MKSTVLLFSIAAAFGASWIEPKKHGHCSVESLLSEQQCRSLALEYGIQYARGTTCEGSECAPRGCYLYNQEYDKHNPGLEIAVFYNNGKHGHCSETRACYCDSHLPHEKHETEIENHLVYLEEGNCNKGTGLHRNECESLAHTQHIEFHGTSCDDKDCAPPGCYLYNGRVSHRNQPYYINDISYTFNDYKTGHATHQRQSICKRDDSGEHEEHHEEVYGYHRSL